MLFNYDTVGWEPSLPSRPDASVVPSRSLYLCFIDYYLFSYAKFQKRSVWRFVCLTLILFYSHCYLDLVRLLRLIMRWKVISESWIVNKRQDLRGFGRLNYVRHLGIPCKICRRWHANTIILLWIVWRQATPRAPNSIMPSHKLHGVFDESFRLWLL